MRQINQYFDIVHKHTPDQALIGLTSIVNTYVNTRWYQRRYIDKLITDALAVGTQANVYARVTPLARVPEHGRGVENASLGASCLFLDYDTYTNQLDGVRALEAYTQPPTLIANSGNGLHAYWQLDRFETDLEALKARNKQLTIDFGGKAQGGDSCFDMARILRVPETFNVKNATPLPCTIVSCNATRIYPLCAFAPATLDDNDLLIAAWDSEPLPSDFIDTLRDKDAKLVKRILSEAGAKKVDAALNSNGNVDRSRNDAYIATRLLSLGYSANTAIAVLMTPDWFSGSKYNERKRYDYVVMTVNAALKAYANSPDRYFNKSTFITDNLADELQTAHKYIFVGEKLWRYTNGVFIDDGEQYIKAQVASRLGKRWSSRASDETVRYVIDRSAVALDAINQHPELINCANGMLNITTSQLLPHSATYLSTAQLPVAFDPQSDPTMIDRFFSAILPLDTIDFFWEYVGSTFNRAHYWPKAFLSLIGPKDCGKSKVIEWLVHFFGHKNIATKTFQTLADNRFASAALFGRLANLYDDLDEAEAQNVGLIKALTGDTRTIDAERKFKDSFSFKNVARFFFTANDFISVRSPDDAFFSRANTIKCSNVFNQHTADPNIIDKMTTPSNLSAGLNRALQGLQRLYTQNGFTESASIAVTSDQYRFTADTVSGFLHMCDFDPAYYITKKQMYQLYRTSCKAQNRKEVSEDRFFKRVADNLTRFGMTEEYKTLSDGTRQWCFSGRKPQSVDQVLIMPNKLEFLTHN